MSSSKILNLYDQGKQARISGELQQAKEFFLAAAEIALESAKKTSGKEKRKFEKLARAFIDEVKEFKTQLETQEKEEKHVGHKLVNPNKQFPPKIKSRTEKPPENPFKGYEPLIKSKNILIPLGKIHEHEELVNWMPGKEMNGFVMITGGSGSGKTEGLKSLVIELMHQGYPCLILDLHGDLDLKMPQISLDYTAKYGINPLQIVNFSESEGGPLPKINEILERLEESIEDGFSPVQENLLREMLRELYKKYGITQTGPETWHRKQPTFGDLINHLKKRLETIEGRQRPSLNALISRLNIICDHPAFIARYTIPIESLLNYSLRIQLKPLRSIGMQFLAADTIMRQIFTYLKSKGHYEGETDNSKYRMFIVVDEVKILMGYKNKPNDAHHILNILATEARKFGIGLILAGQVIDHFGKDIRANIATKILLKPMDQDQVKKNAKELNIPVAKFKEISLPGEGYILTSHNPHPIRMRLILSYQRPFG